MWIHVFIDVPRELAPAVRDFWSRALGWPVGEPWAEHPEFSSFQPPGGDAFVHVQEVGSDPRVHLDVVVDDLDSARDRLRAMGAGVGARTSSWQVMSSPGGLPFCLCLRPVHGVRPGATVWGTGHRSRLVQACLDVPAAGYERETEFWSRLTGWQVRAGRQPEFTALSPQGAASLRLVLQRLGPDDPATSARVHLDLGTDDLDAEVTRLEALGARRAAAPHTTGQSWVVLRDPADLPFCVTS